MKLLNLYKPFIGTKEKFINEFQNNDAQYDQAKQFWNQLESISLFVVLMFIVLGIGLAAYYYCPYNNSPGRRYTPKHWGIFWLISFVVTFVVTLSFEYLSVAPKLDGAFILEMKIAIGNAFYGAILYLFVSVLWCNTLPTNAYKIFKK